jgi:hypothetical protein
MSLQHSSGNDRKFHIETVSSFFMNLGIWLGIDLALHELIHVW